MVTVVFALSSPVASFILYRAESSAFPLLVEFRSIMLTHTSALFVLRKIRPVLYFGFLGTRRDSNPGLYTRIVLEVNHHQYSRPPGR